MPTPRAALGREDHRRLQAPRLGGERLRRALHPPRAQRRSGPGDLPQRDDTGSDVGDGPGRSRVRPKPTQDAKKCPRTRVDDGFVLVHADRLIFGPCYFVFVQPNICSAEVLIASGEADFTTAQMEEMREKRSATEKRIRQSLYSPCMVLPGLEDAQHFEQMQEMQKELEQVKEYVDKMRREGFGANFEGKFWNLEGEYAINSAWKDTEAFERKAHRLLLSYHKVEEYADKMRREGLGEDFEGCFQKLEGEYAINSAWNNTDDFETKADRLAPKLLAAIADDGPGFFYLKFPSVDALDLAERTLELSRRFFQLPSCDKVLLKNDEESCYWEPGAAPVCIPSTGPGYRGVSGDCNFAGDRRESFNLGRAGGSSASPEGAIRCGMGENLWPEMGGWCEDFRRSSEAYFELCFATATALRRALARPECLGPYLSAGAAEEAFERSTSLLGFTHYNYEDFRPESGYAAPGDGALEETQDDGLCTLLYTDGQPGLEYAKGRTDSARSRTTTEPLFSGEFCRTDAQFSEEILWEPVPFLPGYWIVNLGTDLYRWAQQSSLAAPGRVRKCKATLHRVA
eukprot:g15819.t1